MNGFVKTAIDYNLPPGSPLTCFNETSVPSISTLAQEFALIDDWFSDIPGPTICNRLYVFSGTSHGAAYNDKVQMTLGYPQKSIFHNLEKSNLTFDIFFGDFPTAITIRDIRLPPYLERFKFFEEEFEKTASEGRLANYTFLEPKYFSVENDTFATDQHPSHNVAKGEELMAKVYKILRASPQWNETALLITYDEHGGFFDHVPTPFQNIPNPDGLDSINPPFNFTQLGVRVPAVLISPWINQGTLLRGNNTGPTPSSQFSHSSVPATIKNLFNLPTPFLTKRDAWAATFENAFLNRTSPRTDCPMEVPTPPSTKSPELMAAEYLQPINELQWEMIELANTLGKSTPIDLSKLKTEQDGGKFVMERMRAYLKEMGISRST
jgi:phospholipase C